MQVDYKPQMFCSAELLAKAVGCRLVSHPWASGKSQKAKTQRETHRKDLPLEEGMMDLLMLHTLYILSG